MSSNSIKYFLFTQAPLHVGAGQSVGYVDLPIQREAHTRIPIVPGSSLKGVLRDAQDEWDEAFRGKLFGRGASDNDGGQAGALLIGEARVLAFPVRSAKAAFAWITCPLVLHRARRDGVLAEDIPTLEDDNTVIAGERLMISQNGANKVVLEEYTFTVRSDPKLQKIEEAFAKLLADEVWGLVKGRLVIVSDSVFSHFVQAGCPIEQHVKIDDETGTAADTALYNEEVVPSETLFYGIIAAQAMGQNGKNITAKDALNELKKLNGQSLQIGGGETTGMGWCTFALKE